MKIQDLKDIKQFCETYGDMGCAFSSKCSNCEGLAKNCKNLKDKLNRIYGKKLDFYKHHNIMWSPKNWDEEDMQIILEAQTWQTGQDLEQKLKRL